MSLGFGVLCYAAVVTGTEGIGLHSEAYLKEESLMAFTVPSLGAGVIGRDGARSAPFIGGKLGGQALPCPLVTIN